MKDIPRPLSGKVKGSFAYVTIKDRLPIIITKIIDTIHRGRSELSQQIGKDVSEEVKAVVGVLSELRYRMTTNKAFHPIHSALPDAQIWNTVLEKAKEEFPGGDGPSWFRSPWLLAECYMYRRIAAAFEAHLCSCDPFSAQKEAAFAASTAAMELLATFVLEPANREPGRQADVLSTLLQAALWGNRCDLSISAGEVAHHDASPLDQVPALRSKILVNDVAAGVAALSGPAGPVSIVLDNAGLELFGDLALAVALLHFGLASTVTLHGKALPWFVSDVTAADLDWTRAQLAASPKPQLQSLAAQLEVELTAGRIKTAFHQFWTLPHPYCKMEAVAPDLHEQLRSQKLVIFKGDLNYRKLVSDLDWACETSFVEALRGFGPSPLLSLRTLKADLCVGLPKGEAERLTKEKGGKDWMLTGEYAVIQFHAPAELREKNTKLTAIVRETEKSATAAGSAGYADALSAAMSAAFPGAGPAPKDATALTAWLKTRVSTTNTTTTTIVKTDAESAATLRRLEKENADLKAQLQSPKVTSSAAPKGSDAGLRAALQSASGELARLEAVAEEEACGWRERVGRLERQLIDQKSASNGSAPSGAGSDELSRSLAEAAKLRGMLKTGQDALRQETEAVAALKAQLKALQVPGEKGLVAPQSEAQSGGQADLHNELQQIRSHLSERSEQLEREMAVNKTLASKLASLGVAVAH